MSSKPYDLMPHQRDGAAYLARRRFAYLADVPGLGKTRTLLSAARLRGTHLRVAIVGPAVAEGVWKKEAADIGFPLEHLHFISFQSLVVSQRRVAFRSWVAYAPCVLIIDEAQAASNVEAKCAKAVFGKEGVIRIPTVSAIWCASGTFMRRNPSHLYPVLASCFPGVIHGIGARTYDEWIDKTCWSERRWNTRTNSYERKIVGATDPERLNALLFHLPDAEGSPPFLRRTLNSAGVQLPPLWWQWSHMTVTAPEAADIAAGLDDASRQLAESNFHEFMATDAGQLTMQKVGLAKADQLAAYLRESFDPSDPLVIFAHHRAVIQRLSEKISDLARVVVIDGRDSGMQKAEKIAAFQRGDYDLVLASINAMQTAATLTRARRAIILEPSWVADSNVQAIKRVHRIGQANGCIVALCCATNTIDRAVQRQVMRELSTLSSVYGDDPLPQDTYHA